MKAVLTLVPVLLTVSSLAFAETTVQWRSNGNFLKVLEKAGYLKLAADVDLDRSQCEATILRPAQPGVKLSDPKNSLTCTVAEKAGATTAATVDIGKVAFESWGNRYDTKPVQVHNDETATRLTGAMAHLYQDKDGKKKYGISRIAAVSPDGRTAVVIYSLDVDQTEDSASYLNCSVEFERTKVDGPWSPVDNECTFMFP